MVDTINPGTNQPDVLENNNQSPMQSAVPENRFYGGFDRPDETKINLADSVQQQPSTFQPQPSAQPVGGVTSAQPAEKKYSTYVNTADAINWRGIIVIGIIGLIATMIIGGGIYFGITAMNNTKIKDQETQLENIRQELATLKKTPTPLTVSNETTTPTETTPAVTTPPVTTPIVTPTPVVTPETTIPAATEDADRQAAG